MLSRILGLARLGLVVAAVCAGSFARVETPAMDGAIARQDVSIRKLHLVRPDLIPYPLFFEVVC